MTRNIVFFLGGGTLFLKKLNINKRSYPLSKNKMNSGPIFDFFVKKKSANIIRNPYREWRLFFFLYTNLNLVFF